MVEITAITPEIKQDSLFLSMLVDEGSKYQSAGQSGCHLSNKSKSSSIVNFFCSFRLAYGQLEQKKTNNFFFEKSAGKKA